MWSTPQPTPMPQEMNTRAAPMIRIERMIPRPTDFRGLLLSSASGAAASHPVSAKIPKVTPR